MYALYVRAAYVLIVTEKVGVTVVADIVTCQQVQVCPEKVVGEEGCGVFQTGFQYAAVLEVMLIDGFRLHGLEVMHGVLPVALEERVRA